jgi:hypothetical protein
VLYLHFIHQLHVPTALFLENDVRFVLGMRLGKLEKYTRFVGKKTKFLSLPGIEPQFTSCEDRNLDPISTALF